MTGDTMGNFKILLNSHVPDLLRILVNASMYSLGSAAHLSFSKGGNFLHPPSIWQEVHASME